LFGVKSAPQGVMHDIEPDRKIGIRYQLLQQRPQLALLGVRRIQISPDRSDDVSDRLLGISWTITVEVLGDQFSAD
jgi:hypothetical protein